MLIQDAGRYAYVPQSVGWMIIDVSDPSNCSMAGWYWTEGNSCEDLAVAGHYAYLVGERGLTVMDVSDPSNCVAVG